ncbi:MAG: lysozyme [Pseudomonadota bacterium]
MIEPRSKLRISIASLAISASAFLGLIIHEGYSDKAYIPIPGDVPTLGFGTTHGVQMGQRIDPVNAVSRALNDVSTFEGSIKSCVKVPLAQHEYDSLVSFTYNVGSTAFCNSTLVKKLNTQDYEGACLEMLRWTKSKGKQIPGLIIRRQKEFKQCMGLS